MLEAGRVLSSKEYRTEVTLKFIAFGAEETGLDGSEYYVVENEAEVINRGLGMINLDMVAVGDTLLIGNVGSAGSALVDYTRDKADALEIGGSPCMHAYIQSCACANEAHHLEETAQAHFRAGRYKEAIESYEKFLATPQEELPEWFRKVLPQELGVHYFRVAFAKAAMREIDGALAYLEKAVDNGWLHIDFLKSCKEFESVHRTSAWNRILEKIQKTLNER